MFFSKTISLSLKWDIQFDCAIVGSRDTKLEISSFWNFLENFSTSECLGVQEPIKGCFKNVQIFTSYCSMPRVYYMIKKVTSTLVKFTRFFKMKKSV